MFGENPLFRYLVEVTCLQYGKRITFLQESLPRADFTWALPVVEYKDSYALVGGTNRTTVFVQSIEVSITGSTPLCPNFFEAVFCYSLASFNQVAGIRDPLDSVRFI